MQLNSLLAVLVTSVRNVLVQITILLKKSNTNKKRIINKYTKNHHEQVMENFYNMTWGVYFHATWDKIYRIKSIKKCEDQSKNSKKL